MKNKIVVSCLLVVLAIAIFAVGCAKTEESEHVVLRLSSNFTATELASEALEKMVELVDEKTNGTVEIQYYPAGQLGDPISEIESVSMGSIEMFSGAANFMGQFVPDSRIAGMFFVFDDDAHLRKYLDSDINKGLEKEFLDKHNIKIISNNWIRGPRSFASKNLIESVNDLAGQKIRAPEIDTFIESFKALGAQPTIVPWGETYLALSQGVAEIVDGPLDMLLHNNLFEVCKYVLLTEHVRDNNYVAINNNEFEKLSKEQQDALIEAANEAGDWFSQTLLNDFEEVIKEAKELGVTFTEVDDITPYANKMVDAAKVLEKKGLWRSGLFTEVRALR